MDSQLNLRKFKLTFFAFACIVILIIFLNIILKAYNKGTIVVTTNSPYATISISPYVAGRVSNSPINYKDKKRVSDKLKTGQYIISVQNNSVATSQIVTLKAQKTQTYNINPVSTAGVEPVADQYAQNLVADKDQLLYLDDNGVINKIDSGDNISQPNPSYSFRTVKWANTSFGVGESKSNYVYSIVDGQPKTLSGPFSAAKKPISFDVSSDEKIYVAYGPDIYFSNAGGQFKKIYTATSPTPVISAQSNGVAVADTVAGATPSKINTPFLAVVNNSGKVNHINQESERMAWSPNGQYLLSLNESDPIIYNSSLNKIGTVPTGGDVGQVAWLNNNTLFYTINSQLWSYSLHDQKSQLVANMPQAESITNLSVGEDESYVYVTTYNPNSSPASYSIRRVGLKNQKVANVIYQLQDILPEELDGYSLGIVNFSGTPTVEVSVFGEDAPSNALQLSMQQLQSDGFDLNDIRFESQVVASD